MVWVALCDGKCSVLPSIPLIIGFVHWSRGGGEGGNNILAKLLLQKQRKNIDSTFMASDTQ